MRMVMRNARRVLPGMQDMIHDGIHADTMLHLRKHVRPATAHLLRIPFHDIKVCTHHCRQIRFVDYQEIALCDPRATFARNLVAA